MRIGVGIVLAAIWRGVAREFGYEVRQRQGYDGHRARAAAVERGVSTLAPRELTMCFCCRSTSKASYLASHRRERDRGLPNFEGSYKRTMSPSERESFDTSPPAGNQATAPECERVPSPTDPRESNDEVPLSPSHPMQAVFSTEKKVLVASVIELATPVTVSELPDQNSLVPRTDETLQTRPAECPGDKDSVIVQDKVAVVESAEMETQCDMPKGQKAEVQCFSPPPTSPKCRPYSPLQTPPQVTGALQLVQRSEVVLRVNAATSDASSQTELDKDIETVVPPKLVRQKLQEELECERLSLDLASHLPPSDKLQGILAPEYKKPTDYVSGLFRLDITSRPRPTQRISASNVIANNVTSVQNGYSPVQEERSVTRLDYSSPVASLVLTDSFEKLPDQIMYPYAKPYDMKKHLRNRLLKQSQSSQASLSCMVMAVFHQSNALVAGTLDRNIEVSMEKSDVSPLPASSAYFTTSESKAKFLTRYSEDMSQPDQLGSMDLLQKKVRGSPLKYKVDYFIVQKIPMLVGISFQEELMSRLDRKLEVLRGEHCLITEESGLNDQLGETVATQVTRLARPHEAAKYRLHVEEVGKITSLLLGLSGRLARAENALVGLPPNDAERFLQSSVHGTLAFEQEHRVRHSEQLQLTNSLQAAQIEGREDQTGTHSPAALVHSHPSGPGTLSITEQARPQTCSAWYAERRQCCLNASLVGGKLDRLRLFEKILEGKRDKLREQLEEAKKLKENIDRRSVSVSNILYKYFTEEEYTDYDHFINMKAKLIMDSREIVDKIKLGEEQLLALKETLSTPD
uniref:ASD2 domain-containing protein n=1 Tax=Timema shepardi TaxID=629360 RepID=A0A7R9AQA5_TIMSH|nr:unnamed protein product [Timema shepardi]